MVGIEDIGYINARFHGLRSRLLSRSMLYEMTEVSFLDELIQLLRESSYREFIQRTLLLGNELYSIDTAINEYISYIIQKILRFTIGELNEIFSLLFNRFDVANLKVALKGLVSPISIDRNLIPFGQLSINQLSEISRVNDLRQVCDLLYTYRSPLVRPLRSLIDREINLFEINLVLDKYYYKHVLDTLISKKGKNIQIALNMFKEELEYLKLNFLVVYISLGYDKDYIIELEDKSIISLFDPAVRELIHKNDINSMISFLKKSKYEDIFRHYNSQKDFSEDTLLGPKLERKFVLKQIRKAHRDRDSIFLGISYFWQLYSEMINLRLISHGIIGSVKRESIRRNLIV